MAAFEVIHLRKSLGGRPIVEDISFSVEAGEFFVLLGPSGGGKSTLLRLISGLEQPDAGEILINGLSVTSKPARERNIGMVFQDYGLYPNMNVYQNIAYGLETRGVKREEIAKRIPPVAAKLGLEAHLNHPITDLSGGEQQRVALARAMVKDADVYLYDEPLSNLDPKLRYSARNDILSLHRSKQRPSLYVTHDQVEAFALADRIAILAKGRLQQVGTVDDLLNAPANMFVASFVGSPSITLIEAPLISQNGHYAIDLGNLHLPLAERWKPVVQRQNFSTVIAGLRPDIFSLQPKQGHPNCVVQGTISDIEILLGEVIVTLQLNDRHSIVALLEDDGMIGSVGDPLSLAVDLERVLLFNAGQETALA